MIANIVDNRWLVLDQIPPDVDDLLDAHFSFKDPNFRYIEDAIEQNWDGVYHKYHKRTQKLSRAFLDELRLFCGHYNIPLSVRDLRSDSRQIFSPHDIRKDILNGITLYPHQLRGLKACTQHEVGIHHMMTGAGKTELMCAIAKLAQCPTMIIAEERVIIDQIEERLKLRKVIDDVGVFYGGRSPNGQLIYVGSIASLVPPTAVPRRRSNEKAETYQKKLAAFKTRLEHSRQYQQYLRQCQLLLIDECDRCTSAQYGKLLRQLATAQFIYGFSGTLPTKDDEIVQYWTLKERLGSVISRAQRKELEAIGRIIPIKYITICMGNPSQRHDNSTFDVAVKKWIEENDEFHRKILEITQHFQNETFLILVENIKLGTRLEKLIPGSKFIHGSTTQKARNKALDEFKDGSLRVLIGSKILKRGLDIKGGIDNLIICASHKKKSEIDQRIGRVVRVNKRGWARVFDFLFLYNKHLLSHSRARLKRVVAMEYDTTVITRQKALHGVDVLKRGFNLYRYC